MHSADRFGDYEEAIMERIRHQGLDPFSLSDIEKFWKPFLPEDKEKMMRVELYSKRDCNYCSMAKVLLSTAGIPYKESVLDEDFTKETLKKMFPSALNFPIVVVDGFHIGGYTQLSSLVEERKQDTKKFLTE